MTFDLRFATHVEKDLRGLSIEMQQRIVDRLMRLADEPLASGTIRLQGERAYRVRVGEYRIVSDVDPQANTVIILKVGHRSDIYR